MIRQAHTYRLCTMMLSCLLCFPGYGHLNAQDKKSVVIIDSLNLATSVSRLSDSLNAAATSAQETAVKLTDRPFATTPVPTVTKTDTATAGIKDSIKLYKPDPTRAIWYSVLFPGLGQLYNRRYWKLPVIAGGIAGIAYAINWNSKYYVAYTNAYRDISDNNPETQSYLKLLPSGTANYNESYLETILKNRQQSYRRTRDLSFICAAGLYLICILDAYVDAQLYNFDITPNLSLCPVPASGGFGCAKSLELSLSFRF